MEHQAHPARGAHPLPLRRASATRACSGGSRAARATTTGACLALARLCTVDEYLDHLAAEIAYLDQTPGRLVHALEDASYDAWIKLYRPDENSPNSTVSYYRKGEVVCALLDLEIRGRTRRARTRSTPCSRTSGKSTARRAAPRARRTRCRRSSSASRARDGRSLRRVDPLTARDSTTRARSRASGSRSSGQPRPTRRRARSACACASEAGRVVATPWRASRGPGARGSTPATRSSRVGGRPRRGDQRRGDAPRSRAGRRGRRRGRARRPPRSRRRSRSTRRGRPGEARREARRAAARARAAFAAWLGQPHPPGAAAGDAAPRRAGPAGAAP